MRAVSVGSVDGPVLSGSLSAELIGSPAGAPEGAGLAPLDTASLRDRARRSIRASIVAGEVEAGKIYPIGHFASRLGVSATPIREALFDLAGTGIVEFVHNRGFRVPVLTDEDLDELLDLRLLLERAAVVRVAEGGALPDGVKLHRIAAQILEHARSQDILAFLSADRHFHRELLRRSGNQRLVAIVTDLRDQTRLYGLLQLAQSGELLESAREHSELLQAIEAGDGPEAHRLMTRHLLHTRGAWAGREEKASPEAGPDRGRS